MTATQFLAVAGSIVLVIAGGLMLIGCRASRGRAFSIYAYERGIRVVKEKLQDWMRR
jgi:hypothetical protein